MSLKARAVTKMATTTRPLQSLACPEVSDYEVHTLRRGRRSFEPAQTCCRILITDLMSRQSTSPFYS